MMMTLVHALLQPYCSLYSADNEEEYIKKRYSGTENQDRGRETRIVTLNNNVTKHVAQASTEVANDIEINHRIYEQHAVERHEIHRSIDNDASKASKLNIPKKENVIEELQIKSNESKTQNELRYMKDMINPIENIDLIDMMHLNNLIILLKKKVYLYLISQILKYNQIMKIKDVMIIANWKTNTEMYDMLSKYFKTFSTNRKYFITWKVLSLTMNDIPAFKEIARHWSRNVEEYEESRETTKIKQEGSLIIIHLIESMSKYDIIGRFGTKVRINAEIIAEYVEVLDLIKSDKENKPLPIENNKFNRSILNLDKDIWTKGDEIIIKEYIKEVWYVTENCVFLCIESNVEPKEGINGYRQRRNILDHEANAKDQDDDDSNK